LRSVCIRLVRRMDFCICHQYFQVDFLMASQNSPRYLSVAYWQFNCHVLSSRVDVPPLRNLRTNQTKLVAALASVTFLLRWSQHNKFVCYGLCSFTLKMHFGMQECRMLCELKVWLDFGRVPLVLYICRKHGRSSSCCSRLLLFPRSPGWTSYGMKIAGYLFTFFLLLLYI